MKVGKSDTRVIKWSEGIQKWFPSFAQPRKAMLEWLEGGLEDVVVSGEAQYLSEAYSHRPDWAENKPRDHWINNPNWRPGIAQTHFGKSEVMRGYGPFSPGVMGVGCYHLENWGEGSPNTFKRMLRGTAQEQVAVWSLGWAKHRPWVWDALNRWRDGTL